MPARELMTVALRIMGISMFVKTLSALSWVVSMLSGLLVAGIPATNSPPPWLLVPATAIALTLWLGLSAGFLFGAPRISRVFYPPTDEDDARISFDSVNVQDVYRIAAFLLGVYVLIGGVSNGLQMTADLMLGSSLWGSGGISYLAIQTVVNLTCGLGLVFGARGLGNLLGRLRPDTENVPAQQFNLRTLVVGVILLIVAIAVLSLLQPR